MSWLFAMRASLITHSLSQFINHFTGAFTNAHNKLECLWVCTELLKKLWPFLQTLDYAEAVFLVVCDPSMNEL
jgi:hypothetical protein